MKKLVQHCIECEKEGRKVKEEFDVIAKTYYRIREDRKSFILCYRHWHQGKRPKFQEKGDYWKISN